MVRVVTVAERRELVDRDAAAARALDLAQDRPLPDHFRIARHLQWAGYYVRMAKGTSGQAAWHAKPAKCRNRRISITTAEES